MELTWETLEAECRSCKKCPLSETRTNCVFGTGNRNADLMFIGEAPGENEDLTGVPFVGRAGQLFDKFLYAVDIPREEVYIANMLKCRPPRNRDPLPGEQDLCIGYLRAQVKLIRPEDHRLPRQNIRHASYPSRLSHHPRARAVDTEGGRVDNRSLPSVAAAARSEKKGRYAYRHEGDKGAP